MFYYTIFMPIFVINWYFLTTRQIRLKYFRKSSLKIVISTWRFYNDCNINNWKGLIPMGLTVKRESNFGSLFDKFASLPDDVKENVKRVDSADKKSSNDQKNLKDKK